MLLSQIIIERIKKEGPISFRDFMEMALYYPELGYYNSTQSKIGGEGDFYTSANLSECFGAMIGRQIEEMWQLLEKKPFTIVEYGAGTGLLCHDILDYLKENSLLYDNLNYCIIEKSVYMREIEKKHLHQKVSWYNSIKEIPLINGCILSNELLDNFSVHQVVMENELKEIYVDYNNGFKEITFPARKELVDYFNNLEVHLPKGFRTEVNLQALTWLKEISHYLNKGYILTIDYGGLSPDLYNNSRSDGTLLCFNKHQKNDNPYQYIGQQDITAHTNFSALQQWGVKYGIDFCGIINQTGFLYGLGVNEYQNDILRKKSSNAQFKIHEKYLNFRLLLKMGMKFKVLIQQKGVCKKPLAGLKYSNSTNIITA
jgi:SAM-dependent MidA family methyltransferase